MDTHSMPDNSGPIEPVISGGSTNVSQKGSVTKLLLGLAALALGQALQNGDGYLTFPAFIWLSIALVCAGASLVFWRRSIPHVSQKILWVALAIGLAWQLFQLLTTQPGIFILPAQLRNLWQFQACVILGGACALLSLAPKAWFSRKVRIGFIVSAFITVFLAGAWMIHASPKPVIDVYLFQQTSSSALLQGRDPYVLRPPYLDANMGFYGAALVKNGKLNISNPYPPLSIYLSFIGYALAGDIRYSLLAAIMVTGLLMVFLRPGREALLAAYIFLFMPRLYYVLEQSWTEPLVLLLAVAVVWCAIHRPAWKFLALGLMIASKQYLVFLSPLIFLLIPPGSPKRVWVRSSGWAVGSAFVVTAPLAFWNFPAFFWDVGLAQWYQVSRIDSLSFAAVYARVFGQFPSQIIPFFVLAVVLFLLWRYGERSAAGFVSGLALGLGLFFAFSKQAFCNYYFLVFGLFCCALAALPTSDRLFVTEQKTSKS